MQEYDQESIVYYTTGNKRQITNCAFLLATFLVIPVVLNRVVSFLCIDFSSNLTSLPLLAAERSWSSTCSPTRPGSPSQRYTLDLFPHASYHTVKLWPRRPSTHTPPPPRPRVPLPRCRSTRPPNSGAAAAKPSSFAPAYPVARDQLGWGGCGGGWMSRRGRRMGELLGGGRRGRGRRWGQGLGGGEGGGIGKGADPQLPRAPLPLRLTASPRCPVTVAVRMDERGAGAPGEPTCAGACPVGALRRFLSASLPLRSPPLRSPPPRLASSPTVCSTPPRAPPAAPGQMEPSPFVGFRDATYGPPDFTMSVVDCLRGLVKVRRGGSLRRGGPLPIRM
jgi:hypothetical protein